MSAAKAKKSMLKRAKAKLGKTARTRPAVAKRAKPRAAKAKSTKAKSAKVTSAAPAIVRPFRFTAAQTVQMRFAGDKKPEHFRVDDMADATLAALDGQTRFYFQYKLISNDKKQPDGSDRSFWFFDPKPVGAAGATAPSLWRAARGGIGDGPDVVRSPSGNFSTRRVTGYDRAGVCHVVKLDETTDRMRFDFNGKREFCDSLPVAIGKGDMLSVSGS